jgi:hypothetical protein
VLDEFGLGIRRPHHVARAVAVAESGTVENDDPVVLGSEINQTAGFEILDHAAVAVKKNQRLAGAPLNVVQPKAVDVEEAAGSRIVTLRFLRKMTIDQSHCGQRSSHARRSYREGYYLKKRDSSPDDARRHLRQGKLF